MKRNDDGYVLPLVLVVLLVLGIVVTSAMTSALQNLRIQHKSVERMQEKYVAEGLIEQVVATLLDEKSYVGTEPSESGTEGNTGTDAGTDEGTTPDTDSPSDETEEGAEAKPDENMCLAIQNKINSLCGDYLILDADNLWEARKLEEKDVFTYTLNLRSAYESREITCKVILSGTMKALEKTADGKTKTTYEAKELTIQYVEYQIGGAEA